MFHTKVWWELVKQMIKYMSISFSSQVMNVIFLNDASKISCFKSWLELNRASKIFYKYVLKTPFFNGDMSRQKLQIESDFKKD